MAIALSRLNMRSKSLTFRLFTLSALWSLLALFVAALIITDLYRRSVERTFDRQLHICIKNIAADLAAGKVVSTAALNLGEANFQALLSGWYWQVRNTNSNSILSTSVSLSSETLDALPGRIGQPGEIRSGYIHGPGGKRLRQLEQHISFDDGRNYVISVAGNDDRIRRDISAFRRSVGITLTAFGIGLGLMLYVLMRYGLRPLARLRTAVADVRRGRASRLSGDYPDEIAPLATELNQLIDANRQVVERARTQVGNLAHALKTPLSVVVNEANAHTGPLAAKVGEQTGIMGDMIDYYLNRAHVAASRDLAGVSTPLNHVLARLVGATRRIHQSKALTFEVQGDIHAAFRGEQQDLEEMIGNLLDNAAKWAASRIQVHVRVDADVDGGDDAQVALDRVLSIAVHDDGPGLDEDQYDQVLMRGKRLDESVPGSGLGLSIVQDLVALYGGALSLQRSDFGGLQATLTLPAAG